MAGMCPDVPAIPQCPCPPLYRISMQAFKVVLVELGNNLHVHPEDDDFVKDGVSMLWNTTQQLKGARWSFMH